MNPLAIVAVHGNGGGGSHADPMAAVMPTGVPRRAVALPGFSSVPKDPALP